MLLHQFSCQKMQFAHFLVNVLLACGFGSGVVFEFVLFMMGRLGEATVTTEFSLSKGQAHRLQNNTLLSRGQLRQLCLKLKNNMPEIISVSGSDKESLPRQMQEIEVEILDLILHIPHVVNNSLLIHVVNISRTIPQQFQTKND